MADKISKTTTRKGFTRSDTGTVVPPTTTTVWVNPEQANDALAKSRSAGEAIRKNSSSQQVNDPTLGSLEDIDYPIVASTAKVTPAASLALGVVVGPDSRIEGTLAEDVTVGKGAHISVWGSVGAGSDIGDFSEIGTGAKIAERTKIGSNTVVMPRVQQDGDMIDTVTYIADDLEIGHDSYIGEGAKVYRSLPPYSEVKALAWVGESTPMGDGWRMSPRRLRTQSDREEYRRFYMRESITASKVLGDQEREILQERYGVDDESIKTVREVAAGQNISPLDIRNIEVKAMKKMREEDPELGRISSTEWIRGD